MSDISLNEAGIEELFHDPNGEVGAILHRKNFDVTNEIKRRLLTPGTGRLYEQGKTYIFRKNGKLYAFTRTLPDHVASAPGESPSSDEGTLLANIEQSLEEDADGLYGKVGSPLKYAEYLELGTSLMEPRPFLRPSLDVVNEAP